MLHLLFRLAIITFIFVIMAYMPKYKMCKYIKINGIYLNLIIFMNQVLLGKILYYTPL